MNTEQTISELHAAGRFEWERVIRRCQVPQPVKLIALMLATYADPDGSRVRPGPVVLAAVTGQSERSVKRHLGDLRKLGLLTVTRRGGGRGGQGRTTEYQLSIPADLLDRVTLLGVNEQPESEATQVARQSEPSTVDEPVDNSDSEATQMARESGDHHEIEGPHSARFEAIEGPNSTIEGPPRWPTTTHIHHPPQTNHAVTTRGEYLPRARAPNNDPHPSLPRPA